ncbi:MAG: GNAT family N-acetyltransferase [Gammaproteobacteria bacterium]
MDESMIANHQIRLALPDDARSIAEMSRDYIENGLGWSWTEARVLRAIRDKSTNVAVVHDRGYILGFGIMTYGDNTAHLVLLGVHKTRRQRGVGASILWWLEECALTAGIERIEVEAREDSEAALWFYRGRGYREIERLSGHYRGIVNGVRLEKRLWAQ